MSDPHLSPHETCAHFRRKTDYYDNDTNSVGPIIYGRDKGQSCHAWPVRGGL